jgi:hypothetical protein
MLVGLWPVAYIRNLTGEKKKINLKRSWLCVAQSERR